jgi:hypothetical protein
MTNLLILTKKNSLKFKVDLKFNKENGYFRITSTFNEFEIYFKSIYVIKKNGIILNNFYIGMFKKTLLHHIYVSCFCWSASFDLVGYNFNIKKKIKKNCVRLKLGFSSYKINLFLPRSIAIVGFKRNIVFFSSSIRNFFLLHNFISEVRHLFPYKKRGLLPTVINKTWLKPGKKARN